jgi:hypothetical protein
VSRTASSNRIHVTRLWIVAKSLGQRRSLFDPDDTGIFFLTRRAERNMRIELLGVGEYTHQVWHD